MVDLDFFFMNPLSLKKYFLLKSGIFFESLDNIQSFVFPVCETTASVKRSRSKNKNVMLLQVTLFPCVCVHISLGMCPNGVVLARKTLFNGLMKRHKTLKMH